MKRFGITMGDPCGVGAEIVVKALKDKPAYLNRCILFGSVSLIKYYLEQLNINIVVNEVKNIGECAENVLNMYDPYPVSIEDVPIGQVSKLGGECAFRYVKASIEFAIRKEINSVVTAPINKEAIHLAGHHYAGHTEIFADLTDGESYAMLLWSDDLKVIHCTTHVSMRNACDLITKKRVADVIHLANDVLIKTGYVKPRIAVAGLNPHAGENGIFGNEEIDEIIPAIFECFSEGIDVVGPIAPDTVFLRAFKGAFDIVVAQYHDQGHIPLKLLAFDEGVNITVGLDVVRTSVDHGTAFDIAGKMIAREGSILKAIEIGEKLIRN